MALTGASLILFSACSMFVMIVAILLHVFFGTQHGQTVTAGSVNSGPPFNNPPGVDIWCGKAYRETNSSFEPGGWLSAPKPRDNIPKLDLRIYPRYSLYLSSDTKGSFIIDTPVQTLTGQAFKNETWDGRTRKPFTELSLSVQNVQDSRLLIQGTTVPVNSWGNEVEFDFVGMPADAKYPWRISAIGASPDAALQTFYSGTHVTVLPDRNDTGSIARLDNLYGGIQVKSSLTHGEWQSIFPYSFYTSWDWISSTIKNSSAPKNLATFRESGFNLIHPVPPGGTDPFDHALLEEFLNICDELELYVMYDMRHTYKNNTAITAQLTRLQHHPSLLLYYTADEPDGHCDALEATQISYQHIKSIDPYHPVSLVLNCANFYFKDYSAGADIILEDVYPLAANTSFSTVYNTPCNTTYGDCGCDNCHAGDPAFPAHTKNMFLDIIERTESLQTYQEWVGSHAKKPIWGVPQAFFDNSSFWKRWPTAEEEAVMSILRVNHGAKGIVAWIYPTSDEIEAVTSSLAKILTAPSVTKYTLGAKRVSSPTVVGGDGLVDAAAWILDNTVLLGVVYSGYTQLDKAVEVLLPVEVLGRPAHLWGTDGEGIEVCGRSFKKGKLAPLEVGIFELQRASQSTSV